MSNATNFMTGKIQDTKFNDPVPRIISNVTAKPQYKNEDIKKLLIEQIEKTVRWRESINYMINSGVQKFIEVGPGKVLSGLVKRIDRKVKLNQINNMEDLNILENDWSKQKNIILTGSTGGIGNAILDKLYNYKANIIATGTNQEN